MEKRERERTGIANLRVEFNRVHGFFIEVTQGQLDKVPADYRRRQTMKNAERFITPELKAFEDKALAAGERALAREKELYEALLARLQGQPRAPAGDRRGRVRARCARLARRRRRDAAPHAPRIHRRGRDRDRRRAPPGGREPGRGLHPQRREPLALAAAPPHHRPEHGRQVDLHAAGGADRAARLLRRVRAGLPPPRSAPSTASSRASAPPTTSPAGARPSWWR